MTSSGSDDTPSGLDRLSLLEQPEPRSRLDAELRGARRIEAPRPVLLDERISERLGAMTDLVGADPVAVELDCLVRVQLGEAHVVGELAVDPAQVAHQGAQPARPVDGERRIAPAQRKRLHHPRQPEEMVGVKVREEDVLDVRQADGAQQLALRALAAVDQQPVAAAPDQHARRRALHGRHRAGRAEEENREVHGARIFAHRAAETRPRSARTARAR